MNNKVNKYPFEFSPKLIKFLGEELIHDKKIAIAELIKNAYDADATRVLLIVRNNKIIIKDNGCGMDEKTIRTGWLVVGDSNKSKINRRTRKYKRMPIGEKGVGRLGVHRLGDKIEVISKKLGKPEVIFEIDWKKFEKTENIKSLELIKIKTQKDPQVFKGKKQTGTKLIIKDLKESITSKDIKSINSDLLKLIPPFKHSIQDNFKIEIITGDGSFEDKELLRSEEIIDEAIFHYKAVLLNNKITKFDYEFLSPNEKKIDSRSRTLEDQEVQEFIRKLYEDDEYSQPENSTKIGKVIFEGYIFDEKFSKLFYKPYSKKVKEYLKHNCGIRVYRDGLRVYNYGEEGKDNDILELDKKRAKRLGDNIGYNQLLASIELDREGSRELVEKTNREGFIHNNAFVVLRKQLNLCMEIVMYCRKLDRAEMDLLVGKEYDKADISTRIIEIVKTVDKLAIDEKEKSRFKDMMYEFSEEFEQIKNIFLTASNTGLNMTFVVHEIDKIIDFLEQKIKEKNFAQIEKVFLHLKDTINAYKDVMRLDKKRASLSVGSIIKQALSNFEFRFECHEIKCQKNIKPNLKIIGKKNLIIGIFINLFDNSIYWLNYYKIKHKEIFINAYEEGEYVAIVVADNGKGFNISFEAALRPFISGRADESSMGIGLHLVEQVMIAHGGYIAHGDWREKKMSEKFSEGAIIKLMFKKE